jgi:hypothetical protein
VRSNDLAHLQLEIARRADQLARFASPGREQDRSVWLEAETEVFAQHSRAPWPGSGLRRRR